MNTDKNILTYFSFATEYKLHNNTNDDREINLNFNFKYRKQGLLKLIIYLKTGIEKILVNTEFYVFFNESCYNLVDINYIKKIDTNINILTDKDKVIYIDNHTISYEIGIQNKYLILVDPWDSISIGHYRFTLTDSVNICIETLLEILSLCYKLGLSKNDCKNYNDITVEEFEELEMEILKKYNIQ